MKKYFKEKMVCYSSIQHSFASVKTNNFTTPYITTDDENEDSNGESTKDNISKESLYRYWLFLIIIIVIVLLMAIILFMRRRRKSEKASIETPVTDTEIPESEILSGTTVEEPPVQASSESKEDQLEE